MNKRIYPVKRDEIYAGLVIGDFVLDPNFTNLLKEKMEFVTFIPYRSILFTIDESGNATDLLYDSPKYPVYGFANLETCQKSTVVVKDAVNIGHLLKFYHYDDLLFEKDLLSIKKSLFSESFARDNCENFGLTRIKPENIRLFDSNGSLITDQSVIKKSIKLIYKNNKNDEIFFTTSSDYDEIPPQYVHSIILPVEYFHLLNKLGNNSIRDVLHGYEDKIDSFKPVKDEGLIRRRKKDQ